jgi:hypothetical protein
MTIAPRVTDHALLRYLERVKKIDVEACRAEIAALASTPASLGADCACRDGHIYVLDGYTVTTVLPEGGRLKQRTMRRQLYRRPSGRGTP